MSPGINLKAMAMESALMLRNGQILLVPYLLGTSVSFFVFIGLFAGLDPELFNDINSFLESGEAERTLLIGTAVYSVLTVFAHGVATAMARELIQTGRTSFAVAARFLNARIVPLLSLSLLLGLSTVVGFAVLLLPGVILMFLLMYCMASFVMDGTDALGAVQRSYDVVTNNMSVSFWLFFIFAAAYFMLNLLMMLLVFIPVLGIIAGFMITSSYMATLSLTTLRVYVALTAEPFVE